MQRWRKDPFNPFLLADLRPVAYMKAVVMAYLDNLIAWADNLFATRFARGAQRGDAAVRDRRRDPRPAAGAITPPTHADDSYDELEPKLDAFANAMVDIENVIGGAGGGGGGRRRQRHAPAPQTFYFKIPPNDKLLGYWNTVADRLFKLRHCQNIAGRHPRSCALFDAPIDPGAARRGQRRRAWTSRTVLGDSTAPLPNYRLRRS